MSQDPQSPWDNKTNADPTTAPARKPPSINQGLLRLIIVAYGAWAAGYLIWSGFFPDLLLWLRLPDGGIFETKWAVGKRLTADIYGAFFWPAVLIFSAWIITTLVAPFVIWIVYRIIRWVAEGFNESGDQK